jgi:Holliday junction DNA helicase RuvA
MIGYLEGRVLAKGPEGLLILTGSGVGYQVRVPLPLLAATHPAEAPLRLYVTTLVRETEIALYGFEQPEGKRLFELLLRATGVGPKLALAFLSAYPPAEVRRAILFQDVALLSSIPGVGKKTAARLCVELSDRVAKEAGTRPEAVASQDELTSALTNLGFPEKDVIPIVRQLSAEASPFSEQVRKALALLARH